MKIKLFEGGLSVLLALGLLCVAANSARATLFVADPDEYSANTNLSSVFYGITLSRLFTDNHTDDGVVAARVPLMWSELTTVTGSYLIFGHEEFNSPGQQPEHPMFWASRGDQTSAYLQVNFGQLTNFVAIDVLDLGSGSRGVMKAFDASGMLLETFITDPITSTFSPVTASITRSSSDISRVIVSGYSFNTVLLDNLRYNVFCPRTLHTSSAWCRGGRSWDSSTTEEETEN